MIEDNKAIFLSHASQDAEAARRIGDALRAAVPQPTAALA
jgi:hypothetical protein